MNFRRSKCKERADLPVKNEQIKLEKYINAMNNSVFNSPFVYFIIVFFIQTYFETKKLVSLA